MVSPKIKSANCKNIVKNFKTINYTPRKGKMILADNCTNSSEFLEKKMRLQNINRYWI